MDVKWIKLSTDVFSNRKIRQLEQLPDGDAIIIIWFKLLVLAGTINDGGFIYFTKEIPYDAQMLAAELGRPLPTVQLALKTFLAYGMIDVEDDGLITVINWERYQNIDGLERIREQTRQRVASYRERQRALPEHDVTLRNVTSNATVTQSNATDKNREEKNRTEQKNSEPAKRRFVPPTVDEVRAYCQERRNNVDPERFVDYYQTRGWQLKQGQSVKDWRACVRTWERSGYNNGGGAGNARKTVARDEEMWAQNEERIRRFLADAGKEIEP